MDKYYIWIKEYWPLCSVIFLIYVLICIVIYFRYPTTSTKLNTRKRMLLVISHPDDECMFFGPTIVNFTKRNKDIYILCLSNGDYYNKGKLRKEELWKSCSILGIPESNIFLHKLTVLPDNPSVKWNESVIIKLVINYVETLECDTVITFDKYGVSNHNNHKDIYFALAKTVTSNVFPKDCSIFCLETVNRIRKYSFFIDVLPSIVLSSNRIILPALESHVVKEALKAHTSQYVWFRKLYTWTSRYSYINTYYALTANDADFDIHFREIYS